MGKKCVDCALYIPEDLQDYDYYEKDGIEYARTNVPDIYYVTNYGDVISFRKSKPRVMKPWHSNYGHLYVQIDGHKYTIHRLVAEAFIPNPNNFPVVRHLDDDPANNWAGNLAWGTHKDNTKDALDHERFFTRRVYCYELDKHYYSVHDAGRDVGASAAAIVHACKSVNRVCQNMHFCYEDELDAKLKDKRWLVPRNNFKPIIAIDSNGKRTRYSSRKAACEALGVSDSGVSNVIAGRIRQTGGWRFEEAAE